MAHSESPGKISNKDIFLISCFVFLVVGNVVYQSWNNDYFGAALVIEQTVLIMLSFVGLIEIALYSDWTILVPDFFIRERKRRKKEDIRENMEAYFNEEHNFIHDYTDEIIEHIITRLGITTAQLNDINLDLIKMRCQNIRSLDDAKKKLRHLIDTEHALVVDQTKLDPSKATYPLVNYYINFTDIMFREDYARDISSLLTFLITDSLKAEVRNIDKVVIPHDSNFLLGVGVGKSLGGKPIVKMRSEQGKIRAEQCWDGNLKSTDKVIIIHDVLVTAKQVLAAVSKLPDPRNIAGFFCLIARKEWDGVRDLEARDIAVHSIAELDDADIKEIIEAKK